MSGLAISLRAGLGVVVGLATIRFAVFRARGMRQRGNVIGRVFGDASSPGTRRARPVNDLLQQPPRRVVTELRALELGVDAGRAWRWWWRSCLAALALGAYLAGPVLGLLAAAAITAA